MYVHSIDISSVPESSQVPRSSQHCCQGSSSLNEISMTVSRSHPSFRWASGCERSHRSGPCSFREGPPPQTLCWYVLHSGPLWAVAPHLVKCALVLAKGSHYQEAVPLHGILWRAGGTLQPRAKCYPYTLCTAYYIPHGKRDHKMFDMIDAKPSLSSLRPTSGCT